MNDINKETIWEEKNSTEQERSGSNNAMKPVSDIIIKTKKRSMRRRCKDIGTTKVKQKKKREKLSSIKRRWNVYNSNDKKVTHLSKKYCVDIDVITTTLKIGACQICGSTTRLCIDHNHNTGKIRGLLCHNCNSAIGLLKDDISRLNSAIKYLSG